MTGGGTDTSGIQRFTPGGSIAGAISIPTRHIHQVIEMADKTDILQAIKLQTAALLVWTRMIGVLVRVDLISPTDNYITSMSTLNLNFLVFV